MILIQLNNRNFTAIMSASNFHKIIVLFVLFFLSKEQMQAQQTDSDRTSRLKARKQKINLESRLMEEGVLQYKKQWVTGFKLTGDGYGGFLEYGRYISSRKSLLYQLDICERKHVKEEKLEPYEANMQPLILGKVNFFYPVKLGAQLQYLLGNKGNTNGVNVTLNMGGGIALALLRPYLPKTETDSQYIYFLGGPELSDGWNKMSVTPGVYQKIAIRFDYGKFKNVVSGIEIGGTMEQYIKPIPQMNFVKNREAFYSIYFSLIMGSRK